MKGRMLILISDDKTVVTYVSQRRHGILSSLLVDITGQSMDRTSLHESDCQVHSKKKECLCKPTQLSILSKRDKVGPASSFYKRIS